MNEKIVENENPRSNFVTSYRLTFHWGLYKAVAQSLPVVNPSLGAISKQTYLTHERLDEFHGLLQSVGVRAARVENKRPEREIGQQLLVVVDEI